VVTHSKQAVGTIELLDFLRARLPRYMVPSLIVTLPYLPLTRNGKVDRNSLPSAESLRTNVEANYVEPTTKMQQTIASIWRKVLQIEKVGINDNFFDLGGNSLLMARVHNELRQVFRKEISMVEMFNSTTISSLTSYLTRAGVEQLNFESASQRARLQKGAIGKRKGKLKGGTKTL
jgi:acyl carrier protein